MFGNLYNRFKNSIKTDCILALGLAFSLAIFAPIEIYINNADSFWFDLVIMFPMCLIVFVGMLVSILTLFGISLSINSDLFHLLLQSVVFFLGIGFYIQGNYLRTDFGVMDGTMIDWSKYRTSGIVSILMWIIVAALIVIAVIRLKRDSLHKMFQYVFILILLIQTVTLLIVGISNKAYVRSGDGVITYDNIVTMSSDENIYVLVLDAFDSEAFNYILEHPEDVDYNKEFKDFTFFRNTVGSYNATDMAVPQILTGKCYDNTVKYGDYIDDAYLNSELLNRLKDSDYSVNIYTSCILPQNEEMIAMCDNYEKDANLGISSKKQFIYKIYKLVGFRYLPQFLKQSCWYYPDDIDDQKVIKESEKAAYTLDNLKFRDYLSEMNSENGKKTFHFTHINGTHAPHDFDRNFQPINVDEMSVNGPEALVESGRGILTIVDEFINLLRENDVYNNTTIIIMSDHGGDFKYAFNERRECPLFMIKGKKESHPFEITDVPFSYFYLSDVWNEILNGSNAANIIDMIANKYGDQPRKFRVYRYEDKLYKDSYGTDIVEYETTSDSYDYDALNETGVIFKAP